MKTFQDLQEGVYDPNILKAFFLAGGPGSGKSYVVKRGTGGLGLKIVNSDDTFEKYIKDAGLSMKMPKSQDLDLLLMVLEKSMIRLQNKQLD